MSQKLGLFGAVVTKISGTEFLDGQKIVKVMLEDGYSFNQPEGSPLIDKIDVGYELDLTFTFDKKNESAPTTSGSVFTFHNLSGVKVVSAKPGVLDEVIAALPTVTRNPITYKLAGSGNTGTGGGTNTPPPKM